jgi:hypothetical protein
MISGKLFKGLCIRNTGFRIFCTRFFKNYKNMEKKALEAALYKLKDSGCSISFDEISIYLASVG